MEQQANYLSFVAHLVPPLKQTCFSDQNTLHQTPEYEALQTTARCCPAIGYS